MRTDARRARPFRRASAASSAAAVVSLCVLSFASGGCAIVGFAAYVAENARRTGSTTYPAEYDGLEGKSYAVIVEADRAIQSEHAGTVERITSVANRMIHDNAGAANYIPTERVLRYTFEHPAWRALSRGELASRLGVERLIVIELHEYQHHAPGNPYVWDGLAEADVLVYESDSGIPDSPAFQRAVRVTFPDQSQMLRESAPETLVATELTNRVARRAAWMFYEHDEPNSIEY